jgi:hypothetical protein
MLTNGPAVVGYLPSGCGVFRMLNSLSETAREYRTRAANARALADTTADPHAKRQYLDFARYWLDRALDYESAEWLFGKT